MKTQGHMRELLTRIGIGQFNATMIVQYMFMAPATTDPKSSAIILLVTQIQKALQMLGCDVAVSGYLDPTTANYMSQVVGSGWESRSWGDNVSAIVNALVHQQTVSGEPDPVYAPTPAKPVLGIWDPPILPAVPGGIITYAVAGYLAYKAFKKRKR
jgi:hypothetical protein